MRILDRPLPVVAAPMAGATTPQLAATVTSAGGLGFLAAGYLTAEAMAEEVASYRDLTDGPVAINLFTPQVDQTLELAARITAHRSGLARTAARLGVDVGTPRFDDDAFDDKIAWLAAHPVDAVSFTFGPVPRASVTALQEVGTDVGFTVTSAAEAAQAAELGADFLVAQGAGAGGHRGTWTASEEPNELDTATVVRTAIDATRLPVLAAGGVAGPADVQTLLDAGAAAAAAGTLFVAAHESKASALHKAALGSGEFVEASVTRAFSGRCARALVNDFVRDHGVGAPAAYPQLHHMSKPLRVAAAASGDVQAVALWAGEGHLAAEPRTAAEVMAHLVG